MNNRRVFLCQAVCAASTLTSSRAFAAHPMLDENDPTAQVAGYVFDAKRVDHAKFPRHTSGQRCSNCAYWQGNPGDTAGRCPLFGNHLTPANGWCNVYAETA